MSTPFTRASGAIRALLGGAASDIAPPAVGAAPAPDAPYAASAPNAPNGARRPAAAPLAVETLALVYDAWSGVADEGSVLFRLPLRAGAAVERLLPAGSWAARPSPSPDGRWIAAVAELDGVAGLWLLPRDAGAPRRLALGLDARRVSELAWSPEGERLAFRYAPTDADADVWVADADGRGTPANLTADLGRAAQGWPAWSPRLADGGTRIAFVHRSGGQARLWTMRPDGSDKRPLTGAAGRGDAQPAWSPDGATIAFQRAGAVGGADLWLAAADGGAERPLFAVPLPGVQAAPAWSPDGGHLAFVSRHEGPESSVAAVAQLYTVRADGTGLARRTDDWWEKGSPAWLAA